MKLYLSSYRIPTPKDLSSLLNKELSETSVALIPNAKDYYVRRARDTKITDLVVYMEKLGLKVDVIDLRQFDNPTALKEKLAEYNLVWAMGGNTYMLRYEMKRSGFDQIINELLDSGTVYGGDSAGALVASVSIAGVELADEPEFAEEVILEGLGLISSVVLPHIDNPEFAEVLPVF
jgi:dipeptidase E